MNKKYFHELTDKEVEQIKKEKLTMREIDNRYNIPDWCEYELEVYPSFHWCNKLMDTKTRKEINLENCSKCPYFKKQQIPQNQLVNIPR